MTKLSTCHSPSHSHSHAVGVGAGVSAHIDGLFKLLTAQGQANYIGETISQLDHSLQAAHFATLDGAISTTIVAALLHDIGQFIPLCNCTCFSYNDQDDMLDEKGQSVGRKSHDQLGATFLQVNGWPSSVYELVAAHVQAKRYLATDPTYFNSLSNASKASLRAQGGPYTNEQKLLFQKDPLCQEKLRLRTYDDQSKVVGLQVKGLEWYRPILEKVLSDALNDSQP